MGEYYYPVLFTEYETHKKAEWKFRTLYHLDGTEEKEFCHYTLKSHQSVKWYYSHDYTVEWYDDDGRKCSTTIGLKMMEHSYFGNKMVNHVMYDLMRNSMRKHSVSRIIWMSDYAMGMNPDDRFGGDDDYERNSLCRVAQALPSGWLNNLRAKADNEEKSKSALAPAGYIVNVDKDEYITAYHDRLDGDPQTQEYWNKNINPLPLLTQFNEGGGGNYRGTNMDKLGTWALDKLNYRLKEPTGMECLDGLFMES